MVYSVSGFAAFTIYVVGVYVGFKIYNSVRTITFRSKYLIT